MSTDALEPEAAEAIGRELRALDMPSGGVPPVVVDAAGLAAAVEALRRGSGPVAVDAERASGHRYGQRAFLVQLRREGSGTVLLDPAALPDLSSVGAVLADTEWVLHAATQDLPCLADVGMRPSRLFDTELGSRLPGPPRRRLPPGRGAGGLAPRRLRRRRRGAPRAQPGQGALRGGLVDPPAARALVA